MGDIRPPIGAAVGAFGLPATLTPPGGLAVQLSVFWLPSLPVDYRLEYRRSEQRRTLVIPTSGLAQLPARGSVLAVAEQAGAAVTDWKVDEADRTDYDHYRVVVVPA